MLERSVVMQESTERKSGLSHAEGLAFKSAAAYFGEELIHWLGVPEKALRVVQTELVKLETRHMYEDFLYEMENGFLYHFEFESDSISEADLKRFREYEAVTARTYGMPVITYVICSSKVRKLKDSITEGINTYRVKVIRLKDEEAEGLLEQLSLKPKRELSKNDMIPLLFAPLMGGRLTLEERIHRSVQILKEAEYVLSETDIRKMEAILYVLAVKFLDEERLKMIKEEMAMTKLGQMIWDDAVEKGREEGERIGSEKASERYSRLILLLSRENRVDQIVEIAADPEYREQLYEKYGI